MSCRIRSSRTATLLSSGTAPLLHHPKWNEVHARDQSMDCGRTDRSFVLYFILKCLLGRQGRCRPVKEMLSSEGRGAGTLARSLVPSYDQGPALAALPTHSVVPWLGAMRPV